MNNLLSFRRLVLSALIVVPGFARADVPSPTPSLPPPNSFFDVFTEIAFQPGSLSHLTLYDWSGSASLDPTQLLPAVQHSTGRASFDVAGGGPHFDSFFDVFFELESVSTDASGASFFDTEMLALNISGGGLPGTVMIRESPTLPSRGQTLIRESPTLGSFQIDSFFDIFTEISLDGGGTWSPSQGSNRLQLRAVPEPASMATLAIGGLALLRRRRRR